MATGGNTIPDELCSPSPASEAQPATTLLQLPVEAQSATPVELDSSSSVAVQPPLVAGGGSGGLGSRGSNSISRKRGRPRKHAIENADATDTSLQGTEAQIPTSDDGGISAPPVYVSTPPAPTDSPSLPPGFAPQPPSSSGKRRRGRPRGSCTKQPTRAPTAPLPMRARLDKRHGVVTARDLKPHTILVSPGEDLTAKIIAFAQQGDKDIFIASHYGAVSSATLRQPTTSTGSMTYEGHYQIIGLSGSLIQSVAPGGKRVWTGGLTVTLSGPDNHSTIVGGVAGPLIAATPIQVLLCTFNLPKEEETELGTVDPVNTMETGGPAAGGNTNEFVGVGGGNVNKSVGVGGGDVKESAGVGGGDVKESAGVGGAGTSILDNFGWDVNECGGVGDGVGGADTSIMDNFGGDLNECGGGGNVNESVGVGGGSGGAGTLILDNFGGDVNECGVGGGGDGDGDGGAVMSITGNFLDNFGGDVNECSGSDGGAGTSITDNFGGDVNECGVGGGGGGDGDDGAGTSITDNFGTWKSM